MIELSEPVGFVYEALPKIGTCKIAGDAVRLTLRLEGATGNPPDVMEVEEWLAEAVRDPLIVEELAIAARKRWWPLLATVTGTTDNHGKLTARCPAP